MSRGRVSCPSPYPHTCMRYERLHVIVAAHKRIHGCVLRPPKIRYPPHVITARCLTTTGGNHCAVAARSLRVAVRRSGRLLAFPARPP